MTIDVLSLALSWPAGLLVLAVLPIAIYSRFRSLTGFSSERQILSLILLALLVGSLALTTSGLYVVGPTREQFVVLAVDQSASIAGPSRHAADEFVNRAFEAAGGNRAAVLPFANQAGAVGNALGGVPGTASTDVGDRDGTPQRAFPTDRNGTDLAAAIQAAWAAIPADYVPKIVLLSDGNATRGDADAAAGAAKAAGVLIWTVPLQSASDPEVYVDDVRAPGEVWIGEPFSVEVVLHASRDGDGVVELFREAESVGRQKAHLKPGDNTVRFPQVATGRGLVAYRAEIRDFPDTLAENNSATGLVFVTEKPKLLLVETQHQKDDPLIRALEGEGIDVRVQSPENLPKSAAELDGYALVMLSNLSAAAISKQQMEALRGYVHDSGGGLVAVGGDQAFTPGGYRGTVLEEALPVISEAHRKTQRPPLAMMLVVDRSLSMNDNGAIELAKQAMRQAVNMLDSQDQVGILAFDESSRWVSPIRPLADKARVLADIATITAGGRTDMYPAMEKAYLALDATFADLKHMIVMTDGIAHPGDFDALTARIARSGITVSTVALGKEPSGPLLEGIAKIGHGHFYRCQTAAEVPAVFALETARASRIGIHEQPVLAQAAAGSRLLGGLDIGKAPSLLGYVETQPRPAARTVLASEGGDPLLAWWRYGRGVSVAFTSDVQSRWNAGWARRWPDFAPFWVKVVRQAMRGGVVRDFLVRVDRHGDMATLTLDAVGPDGKYLNGADVSPDGIKVSLTRCSAGGTPAPQEPRDIEIRQTAPGRYTADIRLPETGSICLALTVQQQGRTIYSTHRGLQRGYPDELRTQPTNEELLRSIAESTGGRYDAEPADIFASDGQTVPRTTLLWPYLLLIAAGLFVLDIAVRRWPARSEVCEKNVF